MPKNHKFFLDGRKQRFLQYEQSLLTSMKRMEEKLSSIIISNSGELSLKTISCKLGADRQVCNCCTLLDNWSTIDVFNNSYVYKHEKSTHGEEHNAGVFITNMLGGHAG